MRGFAKSWMFVAVAVGLTASACKKKEATPAPIATHSGAVVTPPVSGKTPEATATPATPAGAINDDMALLPVDSQMVFQFNFAQLKASPLYALVKDKVEANAAEGLAKFKAKCGWDPLDLVTTMSIGLTQKPGGNDPQSLAMVLHGPTKAQVLDCITKAKDDPDAKGTKITIEGEQVFVQKEGEPGSVALAFPNDTTILGLMNADAPVTADQLKAAMTSGGLKASAAFTDIYGKIATGKTLTMFINGKAPAFAAMAAIGKPQAVFGSVDVSTGLAIDIRMRLETPDQAAGLAAMGKSQLGAAAQLGLNFDKLELTSDAADVRFEAIMTKDQLSGLVEKMKQMIPGMGH